MMNTIKNYKSYVIQLLVQNYLEHEYKNIFVFFEIIDDVDIFTMNLYITV